MFKMGMPIFDARFLEGWSGKLFSFTPCRFFLDSVCPLMAGL
jgi:hypothetical protein